MRFIDKYKKIIIEEKNKFYTYYDSILFITNNPN